MFWYVRRLRTALLSQKLQIPHTELLTFPATLVDQMLVISDEHEAAIDDIRKQELKEAMGHV